MKRIKLFLIYICLFSFINVYAATFEIKAADSSTIREKESATFDVYLKKESEEEEIDQIEFDYTFDAEVINVVAKKNEYGYAQSDNNGNIFITKAKKEFSDGIIASFEVSNISAEESEAKTTAFSMANIKVNDTPLELETNPSITITLKKQITTTTRAKNTSAKLNG